MRKRGRELVSDERLRLRVAERAWDEARHELRKRVGAIAERPGLPPGFLSGLLDEAVSIAESRVVVIPEEAYAGLLEDASLRIPRDPDDAQSVALALLPGGASCRCAIWTNDGDFLGCGIPVWTTDTLLGHLSSLIRRS